MISECYDELLFQSFPMDEWISVNELAYLSALYFRMVSEGLFTRLISPKLKGKVRANFITSSSKRAMSKKIIPIAILITDGVGKRSLGMITVFFHSDQVKDGAYSHAFDLSPVGLSWAGCGGDKDFHQLTLFPPGVFWSHLPGCGHPCSGHLNYPISTFLAMPALTTSILPYSGHPAQGKREKG